MTAVLPDSSGGVGSPAAGSARRARHVREGAEAQAGGQIGRRLLRYTRTRSVSPGRRCTSSAEKRAPRRPRKGAPRRRIGSAVIATSQSVAVGLGGRRRATPDREGRGPSAPRRTPRRVPVGKRGALAHRRHHHDAAGVGAGREEVPAASAPARPAPSPAPRGGQLASVESSARTSAAEHPRVGRHPDPSVSAHRSASTATGANTRRPRTGAPSSGRRRPRSTTTPPARCRSSCQKSVPPVWGQDRRCASSARPTPRPARAGSRSSTRRGSRPAGRASRAPGRCGWSRGRWGASRARAACASSSAARRRIPEGRHRQGVGEGLEPNSLAKRGTFSA